MATEKTQLKADVRHRQFTGVVVGVSGKKTIRVRVETIRMHSKYRKQYVASRDYAVHDEKNAATIGNQVQFHETRPLSKTKRWRLMKIVTAE